ncbi:sugar ABC transporter substrate-binding protein [Salisediminibacterium halotolerans]|uniref:sugar ABC transporter substrate-binding protein n=1 Tax=Salisediminibacterium halotolerans TaxID=517425 RepID=UPI000EB2C3C7|nr:sugar ABC transporter substrate-binding protein [Salisediminibacterium halotolerans]RLJ78277.1 carbohydrate ABC transporter substrate-binding protein (CUT1 family) [Actinophytocola xinjiangensis]RPE88384.1 carbohydrate ABC transporter substrate-binding protein (CUT1 family) [Salisediminibacterium halotolerans]TWG37254.1 carbohydrate ABC transporter substrate-binding protein (CUT1 family) [Salisediminibacterium halotolerans]GEL07733.1 sugar ABC transporter substrate-binding protein [Salisedim
MKKYFMLSSVLFLSGALAACNGGDEENLENAGEVAGNNANESNESNESNDDEVETGEVETDVEATGDESVELEIWIHQTNEDETAFYVDRIDAFNEAEDDIHVTTEVIIDDGASAYSDSVNASLVAGELPDVLAIDGPYTASFADADVIQSIDEYISDEDQDDFVDSIIQQGTYDGSLYTLGAMEGSAGLFYNKEIFEEEGIEAPTSIDDAWDWDEFLDVAKELTTEERYGLNLFFDDVGEFMTFTGAPFIWSNNGALIAEDGSTADGYLNGPESVEAFEFVSTLFDEEVVSQSPPETQFQEGEAAMALTGPWMGLMAEDADMDWGIIPYPEKERAVSPSGSMAYGMTADSENPDEAYELLAWMTNEESAEGLSEVTGMPPSRESVFDSMEKYDDEPWSVIREQVTETAQARPATPAYPVLTDAFSEIYSAAAQDVDMQEIADQEVERVERELERFAD